MNVVSQENANCFGETKRPISAPRPPSTMRTSGTIRHLERSSGATVSVVACEAILVCQRHSWLSWRLKVFLPPKRGQLQSANVGHEDRKSTRLNSSHSQISYAVFCLKKKKKK